MYELIKKANNQEISMNMETRDFPLVAAIGRANGVKVSLKYNDFDSEYVTLFTPVIVSGEQEAIEEFMQDIWNAIQIAA